MGITVAVVVVVFAQRVNDQVIQRQPDGAAPVGIAAKHGTGTLPGFILNTVFIALITEGIRRFMYFG